MNAPAIKINKPVRDQVSKEEWEARVNLAACYRLMAEYGMIEMVANHISVRVPGSHNEFLINPYGMLYEEMTASSMLKIDLEGNVLFNATEYGVNQAGFVIHSAVHAARHDAGSVLHTHTLNGVAVSAQKHGVLPISQQSIFVLSSLGYHGYEGVALRDDEKPRLVADLGHHTHLMLRNHGLLTVGRTVADAFLAMYLFETVCNIQVRALAGGGELVTIDPEIVATARQQAAAVTRGLGAQLTWPGLLRRLERRHPGWAV